MLSQEGWLAAAGLTPIQASGGKPPFRTEHICCVPASPLLRVSLSLVPAHTRSDSFIIRFGLRLRRSFCLSRYFASFSYAAGNPSPRTRPDGCETANAIRRTQIIQQRINNWSCNQSEQQREALTADNNNCD